VKQKVIAADSLTALNEQIAHENEVGWKLVPDSVRYFCGSYQMSNVGEQPDYWMRYSKYIAVMEMSV